MPIIKKTFLFLVILLACALPAWTGEAPLDITTKLDFRATTNFGIDLETGATGLSTVINWLSLSFSPIGYKTVESIQGGNGKPYTYFTVTGLDLGFAVNNTTIGTTYVNPGAAGFGGVNFINMAAKLGWDPLWFGIIVAGSPPDQVWDPDSFTADRAMIGSRTAYRALVAGGMGAYDRNNWVHKHRDLFQTAYATSGRLLIGFDHTLVNVIGKIGSRFDETANIDQEYAFGLEGELRLIDNLHIGFDAYGTTYVDSAGDPMFSLKAAYDIPLFGSLFLQPFGAIDYQPTIDGANMEIAAGINIPWEGGGYKIDPLFIIDNGKPTSTTSPNRFSKYNTFGGLTLGGSCYLPADESSPAKTLIDCSLFEAQGDDGLFLDWGMVLSAQLYDLLGDTEFGAALYLDYTLWEDNLRPLLALLYQNYNQVAFPAATDAFKVHTGIHYIGVPGATIGLEYRSDNLLAGEPLPGHFYTFLSLAY